MGALWRRSSRIYRARSGGPRCVGRAARGSHPPPPIGAGNLEPVGRRARSASPSRPELPRIRALSPRLRPFGWDRTPWGPWRPASRSASRSQGSSTSQPVWALRSCSWPNSTPFCECISHFILTSASLLSYPQRGRGTGSGGPQPWTPDPFRGGTASRDQRLKETQIFFHFLKKTNL